MVLLPCEYTSSPHPWGFYRQALLALQAAEVPFLVGGGHAVAHYVGMTRHSKDLDLFVTPEDCSRILAVLRAAGYRTELTFPHWLGKVYSGSECIDVIFSSGNSIATVDTAWFVPGCRPSAGAACALLPTRRNPLVQEFCHGT